MDLDKTARGQPPAKRVKRSTEQHQRRLQQQLWMSWHQMHDGTSAPINSKSDPELIRALGHYVRVHI